MIHLWTSELETCKCHEGRARRSGKVSEIVIVWSKAAGEDGKRTAALIDQATALPRSANELNGVHAIKCIKYEYHPRPAGRDPARPRACEMVDLSIYRPSRPLWNFGTLISLCYAAVSLSTTFSAAFPPIPFRSRALNVSSIRWQIGQSACRVFWEGEGDIMDN
jgi:hypothetical protein